MKIEIPNNNLVISFFLSFCVYISTLLDVGLFWHIERCQLGGLKEKMGEASVLVRMG